MLGFYSVLDNSGPSRPAPRDGSGAKDPSRTAGARLATMRQAVNR